MAVTLPDSLPNPLPSPPRAPHTQCIDALSTSTNWRDAGLKTKPIKAASGEAKVAAAAGAIRTLMFMERYRSEQRNREEKAKVGGCAEA